MVQGMNLYNSSGNSASPFQAQPYADMSQWWGNKAQAPTQTALNTPAWNSWSFQPYAQAAPTYARYGGTDPTYTGLSGGDYNKLELALRQPGENTLRDQYRTQLNQTNDVLGGRGVYGSSLYTNEVQDNLGKNFATSLSNNASNATAQRYGMEQTDLGRKAQMDLSTFQARMGENDAANRQSWNSWMQKLNENSLAQQLGAQESWRQNAYGYQSALDNAKWTDAQNQRSIDFGNSLAQDWWNEQKRKMQWDSNQTQIAFNNAMQLGQNTDQLNDSLKSQQISKMSQQDNNMGGLLGGLGSLAGTALSFIPGAGSLGGLFSGGGSTAGVESFMNSSPVWSSASSMPQGIGAGFGPWR